MADKPNVANLIEDPLHPGFKVQLVDDDGAVWCALFADSGEADGPVSLDDLGKLGPPEWFKHPTMTAEEFNGLDAKIEAELASH